MATDTAATTALTASEDGVRRRDWIHIAALGTAGVLSLTSRRARTAPTLRGIYVQQRFRCVDLPPPPPDVVDFDPRRRRDRLTLA